MPYDEIHDEGGAQRPAYAALQARSGVDVTRPDPSAVAALARPGIVGREGIHPVPLVLDEDEVRSTLVPGVLQRALLLQALFEDLAIGSARVLDAGLLREDELECILESEGSGSKMLRRLWKGRSREQIRFIYGPDLVRSPEGDWVVLEDNVGCLGGVTEGAATRDAYLRATGLASAAGQDTRTDLARAIGAFFQRTGVQPHTGGLFGIAGWTSAEGGDSNDFETRRKADCLRSFGMTVTRPESLLEQIRAGTADPAAIVNLAATATAAYRDLAQIAFTPSRFPIFGAPGVEAAASKSFLPFDEAFAAELLGEQLVLRSAPSRLVREPPDVLPAEGVLKRSSGCRGTEVFFLDEIGDDTGARSLLEALRGWGPCAAIVQEHVERSVIAGAGTAGAGTEDAVAIEIRPIVYVYGWRATLVGEAVAARAVTVDGGRRANVSHGASFLPVLHAQRAAASSRLSSSESGGSR